MILADEQNRCQTFFEQRLDPQGAIGENLAVTTATSVGASIHNNIMQSIF
ncbi:hypothetical protein [Picosynechococcus sp. NKBG042902]|nr:hypothetical protein [Picosynechococcus sp. NKBG042902]